MLGSMFSPWDSYSRCAVMGPGSALVLKLMSVIFSVFFYTSLYLKFVLGVEAISFLFTLDPSSGVNLIYLSIILLKSGSTYFSLALPLGGVPTVMGMVLSGVWATVSSSFLVLSLLLVLVVLGIKMGRKK